MRNCVSILTCLLIVMAMMWPSEAAIHGDGLHLVVLWIVTAIAAIWTQPETRRGISPLAVGPILRSMAVFLLVTGFWLSTWHVFDVSGNKRFALNLTLEWTAIGIAYWLVSKMATRSTFRQAALILLVSLGFGIAALGLAQHHFMYQRQANWYQQLRTELDASTSDSGMNASVRKREVESELTRAGVPLEGPGRELFERRLLGSSEPIGPFALANSLGGVLALQLVILIGAILHRLRRSPKDSATLLCRVAPLFLMMCYCLLLTKSRTAWIASGVGTAILIPYDIPSFSKLKSVLLGSCVTVAAIVALGIGTGAIDKEVVLESPRSLQFRLLYWMGAAGVIGEEPVFGAGPGNFRQVYLRHKPVETSEEILDPHNIMLDAWCSAGLAGFIGTVIVLTVLLSTLLHNRKPETPADDNVSSGQARAARSIATWGVCLGMLAHLCWRWINGEPFWDSSADSFWESQNLILMVPIGTLVAIRLLPANLEIPSGVVAAAATTLFIHLLGAGGLQITGIGLELILVYALSHPQRNPEIEAHTQNRRNLPYQVLMTTLLCACAWAAFRFGLQPVHGAKRLLASAEMRQNRKDISGAITDLETGIAADPLSVDLRQHISELLTYEFLGQASKLARSQGKEKHTVETQFNEAIAACERLISADRRSVIGYRQRSILYSAAAQFELGQDKRTLAINDLHQVLEMYPTNAAFWAELAELCDASHQKSSATSAAETAIRIDNSNREWGHVDCYLNSETMSFLARLTEVDTSK